MKAITVFVVVSHPVPYHLPMYRLLAKEKFLQLTVFFDKDFINGFKYATDVLSPKYLTEKGSLLSGYNWEPLFGRQKVIPFLRLFATISLLTRRRPDVIICFGYQGLLRLALLLFGRFFGCKIVYKSEVNRLDSRAEQTVKAALKRLFLRVILRPVPHFVVSCEGAAQYFASLNLPKHRQIFMPCAVDNSLIFDWQKKNNWRFDGTAKLKNFVFVGALEERKRPDLLIRAFLKVKNDHDISLKIIGEGRLLNDLVEFCAREPYGSSVEFLGYLNQNEIFKVLSESDALVLPSIKDPSPKVVNEAMCFGLLPILSDQIGTVGDLVKNRENGLVFNPFKSNNLEANLYWAMENIRAVRKMRQASLVRVKEWSHERGVHELLGKLDEAQK